MLELISMLGRLKIGEYCLPAAVVAHVVLKDECLCLR
jgi:hypothetical protein